MQDHKSSGYDVKQRGDADRNLKTCIPSCCGGKRAIMGDETSSNAANVIMAKANGWEKAAAMRTSLMRERIDLDKFFQ